MEIRWSLTVGSREVYVPFTIDILLLLTAISRSGLWQERTLVRHYQTMRLLKYLPPGQLHNYPRHPFPTRQGTGFHGLFLLRL